MGNWQGSGYDFDTCCRMGWADDMRGAVDDITQLKRNKIAHDVAVSERINRELKEAENAKRESEGKGVSEPEERQVERDGRQDKEGADARHPCEDE